MLCPLKLVVTSKSDSYDNPVMKVVTPKFGECETTKCAWYNTNTKNCAIYDIPRWISVITQRGGC